MRFAVLFPLWWAGYLLLAGSVSASELATGAAVAVLATGWSEMLRRVSPCAFQGSAAHLRVWLRAWFGLPAAALRTVPALWRAALRGDAGGRTGWVAFEAGAPDAPTDRARRATAALAFSLSPDSFLLRAERGRAAQVHAIGPHRAPPDPEWLS